MLAADQAGLFGNRLHVLPIPNAEAPASLIDPPDVICLYPSVGTIEPPLNYCRRGSVTLFVATLPLVIPRLRGKSRVMNTYGLAASIAAMILLVFCALAWRQQRRLAAMQVQLDNLRKDIRKEVRRLEIAHEGLLVRLMNLPRSKKARRPSSQSSDLLEQKMTAPKQPDEKSSKESALYIVAPKTSPE